MKRRLVWLLALLGVLWLFRRAVSRPAPVHVAPDRGDAAVPAPAPAEDPAEELRRKLGETRSSDGPGETSSPGAENAELDDKRRSLHEQARSSADEMRRSASD